MIALAIETSARRGSLALSLADGTFDELEFDQAAGHARAVAPGVRDLLERHRLQPRDLAAIVVGIGPGGYTGLRLGLATAKTLAVVLRLPLVGVESTAALALRPEVPAGRALAAVDAKRGLVYAALYQKGQDGALRCLKAPFVATAAAAREALLDGGFVAGDGYTLLSAVLATRLDGDASLVPRARELLRLGAERLARGERDSERTVLPLYLRPSEAERLFDERQARKS